MSATEILTLTISIVCPMCSLIIAMVTMFNKNNKNIKQDGQKRGAIPTYIAGEGGSIKVYYINPGDNNINQRPDEYQNLFSFTISDLVSPVD